MSPSRFEISDCPDCGARMTSPKHPGSKACKQLSELVKLQSKGLVILPVACFGMAKLLTSPKQIYVTGRSIWVKPIVRQAILAAERVAEFMSKEPIWVLKAAVYEDTLDSLKEIGPHVVWNKNSTKPAKLFCEIAKIFGGRLTWGGVRFYADGRVQVKFDPDGSWQTVDALLLSAMRGRARLGTPEAIGETVVRITYTPRESKRLRIPSRTGK